MIWLKNGAFVPIVYFVLLYTLKGNCLLATALTIRTFTINYFFWFCDWSILGQMRQMVRFTDSQTLVCLLYSLSNKDEIIGQLAYNVLAIVTFGFWIAKLMLGIDDLLSPKKYPFLQREVCDFYHYINHGLLFLLLSVDTPPLYGFTLDGCRRTVLFVLFYLMLIYIPWYFVTGDRIYNV